MTSPGCSPGDLRDPRKQSIDQGALARQDFLTSLLRREPRGAVDLWERSHAPALPRPLHLERVGSQGRWIEVALDGEGSNFLSALLNELAEINDVAARRACAKLFFEFPAGDSERLSALLIFSLGNRPGTFVLPCPERTAGMHEQELELRAVPAIH